MKITVTPRFAGKPFTTDIERFAERELQDRLSEGAMEAVASRAANNSRAIGRLLTLLVERNVIGLDDVPGVLGTLDKLEKTP